MGSVSGEPGDDVDPGDDVKVRRYVEEDPQEEVGGPPPAVEPIVELVTMVSLVTYNMTLRLSLQLSNNPAR